jgi:hypothetical protein
LSGVYDTRILLTLGITLGIIAFSIGSALACLRATQAALKARDAATLEAERYRASERMLETILAAEPQVLLTWTAEDGPRVHVANLPLGLGVPSDPDRLLRFGEWLDAGSAEELTLAMQALADRGEAFNLMLRTERQRHVEADGRAAGAMLTLKIRDLAGQRRSLPGLARSIGSSTRRSPRSARCSIPRPATPGQAFGRDTLPQLRSLATAFAVFDADQRLAHFNQAYVDFWQLDAKWLRPIPATERSSIACGNRGTCRRRQTTATGSRAGSRPTAPIRSGKINGICPTGALRVVRQRGGGGVTCLWERHRAAGGSRYNADPCGADARHAA